MELLGGGRLAENGECGRTTRAYRSACSRPGEDMATDRQRQLATAFRARHGSGSIVVLPNAFDVASARLFARYAPAAIGTTSGGLSWSAGYADGEQMPRDQMLVAVARIVASVEVGVTADVESGYGDDPADAASTATGVIESGAIGLNIEDASRGPGAKAGSLIEPSLAAAKIAAVREVAERARLDLVVNARTDVFLLQAGDDERERIELAVERGNNYIEAGADCVFVPGAVDAGTIAALVQGIDGPVSVYALPGLPDVDELERLGVARVSVGTGPYQACLALLDEIAGALLESGSFAPLLARQLAYPDVQELLAAR